MCGYWYSTKQNHQPQDIDLLKRRGPESYTILHNSLGSFGHALLTTIGEITPQPLQTQHGILLYNGSTYNSGTSNDSSWVANNLNTNMDHNIEVVKNLVGEYSLTWVTDSHIVFCVDQWATKNLWFYHSVKNKDFFIASSATAVDYNAGPPIQIQANKIYILNRQSFEIESITNTQWNFEQTKNNYDIVFEEFERAVRVRHSDTLTTYTLSAGFDVGAINCCAQKLFSNIHTVHKAGREDTNIVQKRIKIHNAVVESRDDHLFDDTVTKISKDYYFGKFKNKSGRAFTSIIQNHMIPNNHKILIMGIGGDELYSDYNNTNETGRMNKNNGRFPQHLTITYPWHNFMDTQLQKQTLRADVICGYNGIEGRFPMLDQRLFQSWLNTSVRLKNRSYKDWMRCYMMEHDYPISEQKIGFTT